MLVAVINMMLRRDADIATAANIDTQNYDLGARIDHGGFIVPIYNKYDRQSYIRAISDADQSGSVSKMLTHFGYHFCVNPQGIRDDGRFDETHVNACHLEVGIESH